MKIAIIGRMKDKGENIPFHKEYVLNDSFREIFDELGILLIPVISNKNLGEICALCDGLVLTGGINDVNPKYYNEEPIKGKEYKYDEYPLIENIVNLFVNANKPILGICAGLQEINVIFGGTLYQRISNHFLEDQSTHKAKLNKDSFLYKVYNEEAININSYHRQAIKDVAPNFKVTAISEDGIIEGIEKDNIIAVQWHPETLKDIKLFRKFIETFLNNKSN